MQGSNPSGALSGTMVLDLTRVRAGPTCTRVLSDFGATVIRIEPPAGTTENEEMIGPRLGYDTINLQRGKWSLTINLKHPDGVKLFLRLVESADIVVENYRPGVMDRLGLSYSFLSSQNPRIIMASISGFGQTGPGSHRPGFDQIAQGMGGLMSVTGEKDAERPLRTGIAVADSAAGLYGAIGVLLAVIERSRSGKGQWIQTSLLEAQIAMMDFQAVRYLIDGEVPKPAGNNHPHMAPMGVVTTRDGTINIAVAGEGLWRSFCRAIGRVDWLDRAEYTTQGDRCDHRDLLMAEIDAVFREHPAAHWLAVLEAAGVPAGPIYRMDQVFADAQVQDLGIATSIHQKGRGDVRVIGQPVRLSRTPARIAQGAAERGEHTMEILQAFGVPPDEIHRLHESGAI